MRFFALAGMFLARTALGQEKRDIDLSRTKPRAMRSCARMRMDAPFSDPTARSYALVHSAVLEGAIVGLDKGPGRAGMD
jgi:hypothetical protein